MGKYFGEAELKRMTSVASSIRKATPKICLSTNEDRVEFVMGN